MTVRKFVVRVAADTGLLAIAAALAGALIGGRNVAVGVLVGAALALGSFGALAHRATLASSTLASSMTSARAIAWALPATLRFLAFTLVAALVLMRGWAHPVALLVGLTALPCVVVARGLAMARADLDGATAAWK